MKRHLAEERRRGEMKKKATTAVQTSTRHRITNQPSSKSLLTHLFTHSPVAHSHSYTSFAHSLRLPTQLVCQGFCFCARQERARPDSAACVVAFAARMLGSAAARLGSLESALRQLGSSAARRAAAWWLSRLTSAAPAAPRLRRRLRGSRRLIRSSAAPQLASAGCVDGRGRRGARGVCDVGTSAASAEALACLRRPHTRGARTSVVAVRGPFAVAVRGSRHTPALEWKFEHGARRSPI